MTIIIQLLLLLGVLALAYYFLSNRRKARAKAWVKIGFALFLILSCLLYTSPSPRD